MQKFVNFLSSQNINPKKFVRIGGKLKFIDLIKL